MEMTIMLWIFTGVWPYIKSLSSLFLWFVPPQTLSTARPGTILLWIDAMTKLSIVNILGLGLQWQNKVSLTFVAQLALAVIDGCGESETCTKQMMAQWLNVKPPRPGTKI